MATALETLLAAAGAEELSLLLQEHAPQLELTEARLALRNPHLDAAGLERLAAERRLISAHEIKRLIALHPRTPEPIALALIPTLYWNDLVALGLETRVRPTVRRAGDRLLIARLPGLAVGEKATIARRAAQPVLEVLRHDPNTLVMSALLENPRVTEGLLEPVCASESTRGVILGLIARSTRFGSRYSLRFTLCQNPHTPVDIALVFLGGLKKVDLRVVANNPKAHPAVRQRAKGLGEGR